MRPLDLPDLSGRTIVVVDDNDDALDMLSTFLRACGARVLAAPSAAVALGHVDAQSDIDLILTDLSMPDVDGVELLRRLRGHPSRSSIPTIAVTGFYQSYMDTSGFDGFLRKPVNLDVLCTTIVTVIDRGRPRKDSQRAG